jgi:RNA polymerase sigma factor (TIGR02999 family)
LVHEAFLRLVDGHPEVRWENRNHFLGAAAEAMRRILIERARQRVSQKAGGDRGRISLEEAVASVEDRPLDLLALNEALTELEGHDRQAAELVKLRFFAGFRHSEAAEIMQIERRAADRLWVLARSWLFRRLTNP